MNKYLATLTSVDGLDVYVTLGTFGLYEVSMKEIGSEEPLPIVSNHRTLDSALEEAERIANEGLTKFEYPGEPWA